MKSLMQAFILYSNHLTSHIKYSTYFIIFLIAIALFITFSVQWNSELNKVQFLNILVGLNNEPRNYALQFAFFDYFKIYWISLLLFYMPWNILHPISESSTVSNSLWLRLSQASEMSLTLFRVLTILITALIIAFLSFSWIGIFSIVHGLQITMLLEAGYAITSYVLLSGSIMIWLKGSPTTEMSVRHILITISWILPILLYFFRNIFSDRLNGFYPFSFPYGADQLSYKTLRASFSASLLGILLLAINIFLSWLRNQFYSQK